MRWGQKGHGADGILGPRNVGMRGWEPKKDLVKDLFAQQGIGGRHRSSGDRRRR